MLSCDTSYILVFFITDFQNTWVVDCFVFLRLFSSFKYVAVTVHIKYKNIPERSLFTKLFLF